MDHQEDTTGEDLATDSENEKPKGSWGKCRNVQKIHCLLLGSDSMLPRPRFFKSPALDTYTFHTCHLHHLPLTLRHSVPMGWGDGWLSG